MAISKFGGHIRRSTKLRKAGNEAASFWAWATMLSNENNTGGFIDDELLRHVPPVPISKKKSEYLARACVACGLFSPTDGGYQVCDFGDVFGSPSDRYARGKIRKAVIERDGFLCGICGEPVEASDIHVDHIVAVSNGGQTVLSNLRVTHSRCNMRKGAR